MVIFKGICEKSMNQLGLADNPLELINSAICYIIYMLHNIYIYMGVHKWGYPKNGWFIRENPTKMDVLGVPLFQETTICLSFCERVSLSLSLCIHRCILQEMFFYQKNTHPLNVSMGLYWAVGFMSILP